MQPGSSCPGSLTRRPTAVATSGDSGSRASSALPSAADVKLEVFNVLGQNVAVLVDRRLEAGEHSVSWDASAEASGVYLYRLTAGEYVDTKKMLLLK